MAGQQLTNDDLIRTVRTLRDMKNEPEQPRIVIGRKALASLTGKALDGAGPATLWGYECVIDEDHPWRAGWL